MGEPECFEYRSEHYADGVGLVRGLWSYDFRAHDPAPGHLMREFQEGTIQLSQVDAGTYADVLTEAEPNDSGTPTGSQAIPRAGLISARIARSDAGMNVNHPEVYPNIFGSKTIQDWYRFTMPTTGEFRLDLAGQGPQFLNGSTWNELDMYLFREEVGGSLTYVARANGVGVGGRIAVPSLAAGTYHIGVMAYQTAGPIDYWFVTR